MNGLMLRRSAIMAKKTEGPNGLKPDDAVGHGSTCVASVSNDGLLHIEQLQGNLNSNYVKAFFNRPITIKAGDEVNIKIVRKSGKSGVFYSNIQIGALRYVNNVLWANAATPLNQSYTANVDNTGDYILIQNRGQQPTFTNYFVDVQISINGERVI